MSTTDNAALNVDELVANAKNKTSVKCTHCESLILKPAAAEFVEAEYDLPLPRQKKQQPAADGAPAEFELEKLSQFWVVNDMFDFENIAFSNTVNKTKYLICADCEIGPVGYQDLQTNRCFIALARVKHTSAA